MIFEKLADVITKHPKAIVLVWILLLVAAAYPAMHSSESFDYDSTNVGAEDSEAMEGAKILGDNFDSLINTTLMQNLLITYDTSAHTADDMRYLETMIIPKIMAADDMILTITEGMLRSDTGMLMLAIMYDTELESDDISNDTGNLRQAVKDALAYANSQGFATADFTTYVTGSMAISYDTSESAAKDMSIVDPLAIFMIIVLVGLFFRSFLSSAAAPMVIGVALSIVLGLIFFIGQVMSISSSTQMILIVSMLGAGCDYCIFILSRYREERRAGKDHISACKEAITWAGESVATSGLAVMIGFGSMSICSFGMVSSMGIMLAIGIVVAILAALTMMSSVLTLAGDRLFWPTGAASPKLEKGYVKKCGNAAARYFKASTRFSIKHAKAIVVATIIFTVPMVYVYATAEDSYDMIGAMMSGESADGMTVMQDYVGGGSVMPNYGLFETKEDIATISYFGSVEEGVGFLKWNDTVIDDNGVSKSYSLAAYDHLQTYADQIATMDNISSASTFPYVSQWGVTGALLIAEGLSPTADLFSSDVTDKITEVANSQGDTPDEQKVKSALNSLNQLIGALGNNISPEMRTQIAAAKGMTWSVSDPQVAQFMDWAIFIKAGSLGYIVDESNPAIAHAKYAKITISTTEMALSDKSIETIENVTAYLHGVAANDVLVAQVWSSGTTAVMVELSDKIGSEFLKIELVAVILIIILLFFVMKSYLTPIRSVVTILMSVIWTVAITHLLFTDVLGDGVLWLIPIILLVVCLGLGMDYDILLTTRIKEYVHSKGMTNDEAIENAVLHSGSVITICGIIMGGTFGSMMLASTGMLQQMGFALCFAILVDALIVRTYIVPAAMHLMGSWNWKGPAFLHKKKE